jgi:hypothetical protein
MEKSYTHDVHTLRDASTGFALGIKSVYWSDNLRAYDD